MARTFDSGLSLPIRTHVRNGIISKLAPLLKSAGNFASGIEGLPFILHGSDIDETIVKMVLDLFNGRSPMYGVALGDCKVRAAGAPGFKRGILEVEVSGFCNHQLHLMLGRMAPDVKANAFNTADPGIEVMMELAQQLLTDQTLGAPLNGKAKELVLQEEVELISMREMTMWALQYTIDVEIRANDKRDITERIESIYTVHRIGAGEAPDPETDPLIEHQTNIPQPP
jgi:hypothetical protein